MRTHFAAVSSCMGRMGTQARPCVNYFSSILTAPTAPSCIQIGTGSFVSVAVINLVTENDQDLARAVRACDQSRSSDGYQATFSRKRRFRKKLKKNAIALADKL